MKRQMNLKKTKSQRVWDVLAGSFLAVFFSFFFVFAQASELVTSASDDCESTEGTVSQQGTHLFADHNAPLHLPLGSLPVPPESESKDERETSGQADDEAGRVSESLSLKQRFDLTSDKCLLLHLLNSGENRKQVSLIILHHSWKSFLS
jgi:hypothetical protein